MANGRNPLGMMFGMGGNPYGGMLDDKAMQYARGQGLMAGAGAGLQASGYSRTPVSTGQVLGQMMGAAQPAYQNAMQQGMQGMMFKQQHTRGQQEIDLGKAQLATIETTAAARKKMLGVYGNDPMKAIAAHDFDVVQALYPNMLKLYWEDQFDKGDAMWAYDTIDNKSVRVTDEVMLDNPGRYVQSEEGKIWAWDTTNNRDVLKTEDEIIGSDGRYVKKDPTASRSWVMDPNTKSPVFATDQEILDKGLVPRPTGMTLKTNKDGTVEFSMGGGPPLGRRARGDLETGIIAADGTLTRLNDLWQTYDPRYLTYGGNVEQWFARIRGKIDPQYVNEFASDAAAWRGKSEQYFIDYKKWATGVAAGPVEMAMIRRSIPNADDSPGQWEAKMRETIRITRLLNVRRLKAINDGLDLLVKSEDTMEFLGENPLTSIPDRQERGDELANYYRSMGETDQDLIQRKVLQRLVEEGYGA